ncbi:MAG: MBL fold metallo-hydrolase [Gammaproteobacteria bacterium]|nr:MBL fold metallo-hydrolase [Gammaproteobacteria bacterium]MCP5199152.1 MBL fold metallo-hydrolase [Gammaproteobacteria bacterium]
MLKWKIGDVTISQLVEITDGSGKVKVLPDATHENLDTIPWLRPHFRTKSGKLLMNIQMLIIETPARKMVVDTCIGNDKELAVDGWAHLQSPFLDNLTAMGHPPESIDTVICTHLHVDHVGWNTRKLAGRWVPTFGNARYLMVEHEFEHWRGEQDHFGDVFGESVAPVFEAGLVDLVQSDHDVGDGVFFESTPGHTPGHVSVHVRSQGEEAIITGDMMHHPAQIARPDWLCPFDTDSAQAQATREAFLARYADTPTLILGTHFANPVGGRIVRDGDSYRFDV